MKNARFTRVLLTLLGVGAVTTSPLRPALAQEPVVVKPTAHVAPVVAPAMEPKLVYRLGEGSENWPAAKRAEVVAAMDGAVALYNQIGEFDKQVVASYNAGTPTADGNYNGNIRFGGQIGKRTALHELGHVLGIGTVPNWNAMIVDGKWTGSFAIAQLRAFDGPDAILYGDRQHFWPYGLNFPRESSPENDRRHVMMVAAFRRDLGIVKVKPAEIK